jgi:hypothetical protein
MTISRGRFTGSMLLGLLLFASVSLTAQQRAALTVVSTPFPAGLRRSALQRPTALTVVSAASLHGKMMCGYQGWFRCAGDSAGLGWIHWSRDSRRFSPEERFPAPKGAVCLWQDP